MDPKTLRVLEYEKILARLSGYCDFSASAELVSALLPTNDYEEAVRWLAETTEARLLSAPDLTIGGSHDIRASADLAARAGVLDAQALLDIKSTLVACRDLKKSLEHAQEEAPQLARAAVGLPESHGMVDAITRVLSERGEVLDSASPRLAGSVGA
jgi:DNA mismatch repair protein MutS2